MFRKALIATFVAAGATIVFSQADTAHAQYGGYAGGGYHVFNDGYGNNTYVHTSRYGAAANIAVPYTSRNYYTYSPGIGWVQRNRYVGIDGRWHGSDTFRNPYTGTTTRRFFKRN